MRRLVLLTCLMLSLSVPAHAYIDPGSGSAIMSAIIGFFVVIGLTFKSFWYKIKSFFSRKPKGDDTESSDS